MVGPCRCSTILKSNAESMTFEMQPKKSHPGLLSEIKDPAVMHDVTPPTHQTLI